MIVSNAETFLAQVRSVRGDLAVLLRLTLDYFKADIGTLYEVGTDGLLHLKAWEGSIPNELLSVIKTIPVGKGIAGTTVERNEPTELCNLQVEGNEIVQSGAKKIGVRGSICVPLRCSGRVTGALGIGTNDKREFSDEEITLLIETGRLAAEILSMDNKL